jgi:hypothetical protein
MLKAFSWRQRNKPMPGLDEFARDVVQNLLATLMDAGIIEEPPSRDLVEDMVRTVEYLLETAGRA